MKGVLILWVLVLLFFSLAGFVIADDDLNETENDDEIKVCCNIYGIGSKEKVGEKYRWIDKDECSVPNNLSGGNKIIVDNSYCKNKTLEGNRLKKFAIYNDTQLGCPNKCTCTGSVVKCFLDDGARVMTIYAGKSGNIIVQIKEINMTTKVELYKDNETEEIIGVFKNKTKTVTKTIILPDKAFQKVQERLNAKVEAGKIELDENGNYIIVAKKNARFLGILSVKKQVTIQMNAETGEITKTRTVWWGFLARDVKEE
ncbi:MAG: hypothetical protein AABX30_00365 [Nanoarchaeota archaeon]